MNGRGQFSMRIALGKAAVSFGHVTFGGVYWAHSTQKTLSRPCFTRHRDGNSKRVSLSNGLVTSKLNLFKIQRCSLRLAFKTLFVRAYVPRYQRSQPTDSSRIVNRVLLVADARSIRNSKFCKWIVYGDRWFDLEAILRPTGTLHAHVPEVARSGAGFASRSCHGMVRHLEGCAECAQAVSHRSIRE
jgi:hypothetical protein